MVLEARFGDAARRAGAAAPPHTIQAVAAELIARWSEPHRHYHHLAHLTACLDEVAGEPVVALAVWGHDAIYDPRSRANEDRSASLLSGLLTRCGAPPPVVAETARLIRLTAGHRVEPGDPHGAMLADADLAILASPWPRYVSYVEAVRREYAHVPDDLWRAGRATVLRDLLALPALFHRHPGREQPARANLRRELTELNP